MYDKCYFCLDQLLKLKKESTASFFVIFGRSRGTKEPTYITVLSYIDWPLGQWVMGDRCIFEEMHMRLPLEEAKCLRYFIRKYKMNGFIDYTAGFGKSLRKRLLPMTSPGKHYSVWFGATWLLPLVAQMWNACSPMRAWLPLTIGQVSLGKSWIRSYSSGKMRSWPTLT